MMLPQTFYALGKLLLTAEYFVLDGAEALALPTSFGQSLKIIENNAENLIRKSFDSHENIWFEGVFNPQNFDLLQSNDKTVGQTLSNILKKAHQLSITHHSFPIIHKQIETHLTFPKDWGLGTSSTLIYTISQLFNVNPFDLLKETFGGSGYDIACAGANSPIIYALKNGEPAFEEVLFQPIFEDSLYFIHLGKKQNSREGIARYREKSRNTPRLQGSPLGQYIDQISTLTLAFYCEEDLQNFEKLIVEHENIVASFIDLPRVQSLYFKDFWGQTKSLGAWGGDFIMATSDRGFEATEQYFKEKGFPTVLKYNEMINNNLSV